MATTTLQKITARAKQIRRKKPNMKWVSAVKEASREYNSGKKAPRKAVRKTVRKKAAVKVSRKVTVKRSVKRSVGGAAGSNHRFFVATTTGGFDVMAVNRQEAAAKGRQRVKEYNLKAKESTGVRPLKYKSVHPY